MIKLIERKNIWERVPEYLFYAFVFLLPWQTRWIFREYQVGGNVFEFGRLSLYGFDIVLMVLLLYCSIIVLFGGDRRKNLWTEIKKYKGVYLLGGLIIIYSFLSIIWSEEKSVALVWGIRMFLGFGLFCLLSQINFSKLKLAIIAVMAGAIQGGLGIWQFLNQEVIASKWLGMAGQDPGNLGVSVIEFGLERWLRAYGSMPHPNILGGILAVSFLALVYLWARANKSWQKLFVTLSSVFILVGIILSWSRSAWLVLAFIIIGGYVYLLKKIKKEEILRLSLWVFYLVIVIVLFVAIWQPLFKARLGIGEGSRLEIQSKQERINGWQEGLSLWQKNWITGTGQGQYMFELKSGYEGRPIYDLEPVHNVFLLAGAELGLIGFLLLLSFNFLILKKIIKNRKWWHLAVLGVVYLLFMFDHYWWTLGAGMYLYWLILALIY